MKRTVLLIIVSITCSVFAAGEVDSLLIKGDEMYYNGDMFEAFNMYSQAETADPSNIGAKEGIYNASINSGGIETANKYALKLLKIRNSQINQDRVIYSDALLGKTGNAEKFLKTEKDYYRRKAIFSLAGYGLKQTGYYVTTSEWYKKAINDGFKTEEFKTGYKEASELRKDDKSYLDAIISFYNYGNNDLLTGGYNINLNYNFGPENHKFNINLVTQGTSINQEMNKIYDSRFYDDIGQYELFGQYNYMFSGGTTAYTGVKLSWLRNDYVQNQFSGSAGCKFSLGRYFRANTYFNASGLNYNYYKIKESTVGNEKPYLTFTKSMSSLQYTFDGAFTFGYLYLGGIINLVQDLGSTYAEDMSASNRMDSISENINDKDIRFLYGITAGIIDTDYDIFSSYTTGDMFLVNTSEGRYLNTNDSELKMNILAGVIFKKLFGDWILGYTFSFSDFENYTIMTNSIIANYNWRQSK